MREVDAHAAELDVGGEAVDPMTGRRDVARRLRGAGDVGLDVVEVREVPAVDADARGMSERQNCVEERRADEALLRRAHAHVEVREPEALRPGDDRLGVAAVRGLRLPDPHALADGYGAVHVRRRRRERRRLDDLRGDGDVLSGRLYCARATGESGGTTRAAAPSVGGCTTISPSSPNPTSA